jgi:hypothetical protein
MRKKTMNGTETKIVSNQTSDERTFGTNWRDAAIQITRRGKKFELQISRVFDNGEQDTVTLPISKAKALSLQVFWQQP